MRKHVVPAVTGLILVIALVLAACPNPSGNSTAKENELTKVSALALDGWVAVPVGDAEPNTEAIDAPQYTGTVAWRNADSTAHTGAFAVGMVYQAVVTLTAKEGYTFTGVAANSFTYSGATAVANAADSGRVTITFPAAEEPGDGPGGGGTDKKVSALVLTGLVTAPVRGAQPVIAGINTDQYTGTVAWQTSSGQSHNAVFSPSTVYKAVVTLTATSGYTFTCVAANSFTYSGATAVANAANSGIVTITFPATGDTPVTSFVLTGLVTAPVRGAQPVTTEIDADQYTGTVAWKTEGGTDHTGAFAAEAVYQAVVALTAKSGYTFDGVGADSFTYSGATAVANAANSGIVTITFPATGDTPVTSFVLTGLVTAPVRGAQPVTTEIDADQYTGTVAWKTEGGTDHTGAFAAEAVYKAVVILTAKSGYTFDGVGADSFSYSGATSVTNDADNGTVTITFPATEGEPNAPIEVGNPSVKLYLDDETTPLAHNGSTSIVQGTGIYRVSIDAGYTSIVWYLNGTPLTQYQGAASITLSKQTAGTFLVTVEATPAGGEKQSGTHSFTVQ